MLTTQEAAEKLDISVRRVVALIDSGGLKATRFGKIWLVDENSVQSRIDKPVKRGRPFMNDGNPDHYQIYTLMMKNEPICDFTYNLAKLAVANIENISDVPIKPLGIFSKPGHVDPYALARWISKRCVPSLRPSLPAQLLEAHAVSPVDLMFKSLGLNLSDHYWFRPAGYHLDWNDINCFQNDYETVGRAAGHAAVRSAFSPRPDSSTPGELEKRWRRDARGVNWLVKSSSSTDNKEPYAEVLATKLLQRILQPTEYVVYSLEEHQGRAWSVCPTFATVDTELVPAEDVFTYFGHTAGDAYAQYNDDCKKLGVDAIGIGLDKMIVADYLMSNSDRHTYNFGLIRNVETGEFVGAAPLFDNGAAFGSRQTDYDIIHGFPYVSHPFSEYPLTQLGFVHDYSWLDLSALDGFEDEIRNTLGQNSSMREETIDAIARKFTQDVRTVSEFQKQHMPRQVL